MSLIHKENERIRRVKIEWAWAFDLSRDKIFYTLSYAIRRTVSKKPSKLLIDYNRLYDERLSLLVVVEEFLFLEPPRYKWCTITPADNGVL